MPSRFEQLVLRSPYWVRTLGANYKSWQLDRLRRGGDWKSFLSHNDLHLYHNIQWEQAQIEQFKRLEDIVRRARQHVPFYRKHFEDLPLPATLEHLSDLPFLTKEQARSAGQEMLDEELKKLPYYVGHTSGSTGTPFTTYSSLDSLRTNFAVRDNFYRLHGCDSQQRKVRIGGRLFMDASMQDPPFWVLDYITHQLMFSIYHMSDTTMEAFLAPIQHFKPTFVTGYPSGIFLLAKFCYDRNFPFRPGAVFTDSETLLDYQREVIEDAWDCKIYDYYGMETGWIAGQCHKGAYHLVPYNNIVEIIDETGAPQRPGEIGELVVTDLTNSLMPLIRYRTGDTATWSPTSCDCGWRTPTIQRIEGRLDDIVILPNGRRIGRLDHIFKTARNIRECQIVQETSNQFIFLVVPDKYYSSVDAERILEEARIRLGRNVDISIRVVNQIERTKMGKFRSVISKVNID